MRALTPSYGWHGSFVRVTYCIQFQDMAHDINSVEPTQRYCFVGGVSAVSIRRQRTCTKESWERERSHTVWFTSICEHKNFKFSSTSSPGVCVLSLSLTLCSHVCVCVCVFVCVCVRVHVCVCMHACVCVCGGGCTYAPVCMWVRMFGCGWESWFWVYSASACGLSDFQQCMYLPKCKCASICADFCAYVCACTFPLAYVCVCLCAVYLCVHYLGHEMRHFTRATFSHFTWAVSRSLRSRHIWGPVWRCPFWHPSALKSAPARAWAAFPFYTPGAHQIITTQHIQQNSRSKDTAPLMQCSGVSGSPFLHA